jgi:hypothetical protein
MKRMDWLWIIPAALIAAGTIWGAILTQKYQKGMVDGQEEIKRLNEAIDTSVKNIEELNEIINKTTTRTETIAKDAASVSEAIKHAQNELKVLTERNQGLIQNNLGLSESIDNTLESVEKLNKDISTLQVESQNYLTGGNMFLDITISRNDSHELSIRGNVKSLDGKRYSMRNVRVLIVEQKLAKAVNNNSEMPRNQFELSKERNFKVVRNEAHHVELDLGDILWHESSIPLIKLNWKNYTDGVVHFTIVVKADNFWTIENYLAFEITKSIPVAYRKIEIRRGPRKGEELLKRVHPKFPLKEDGSPDYNEIEKLTGYKRFED